MFSGNIFSNKRSIPVTDDCEYKYSLLECLSWMENEYCKIQMEHTRSTYKGLKYDSYEIIQEGFKEMIDNVVEFFKTLIKKIGDFFKRAFTFILSYLGDFKKFIEKNKDLLDKLNPKFEIKTYEYTFDKAPVTSRIDTIIQNYNSDVSNLKDMKYEDVVKMREEDLSSTHLNQMRAEVMGITGEITEEDYLKEVKSLYRNKAEDTSTKTIDSAELKKVISSYTDYDKLLKDTKSDFSKISGILNAMKHFFETRPNTYYSGSTSKLSYSTIERTDKSIKRVDNTTIDYTTDSAKAINLYFKYKYEYSKALSAMLTNAFYEKIDALKEALAMSRSIIRKAISNKEKKEGIE